MAYKRTYRESRSRRDGAAEPDYTLAVLPVVNPGKSELRIGLHSGQQYVSLADLIDVWQRAEALGYDWVSLFDHWRPVLGGPEGPCLDSTVALASAGRATTRVVAAVMVSPAHIHNPGLLALRIAALDQATCGRLVMGLGAGGEDDGYRQFGLAQPQIGTRVSILEELLPLVRRLLSGESIDHDGEFFRLEGARIRPGPVQTHLPIAVGGSGHRMLRIAGRHADVWNTLATDPDSFARRLSDVRSAAEASEREPESIRPSITFRAVIGSSEHVSKMREQVISRQGRDSPDIAEYVSWGSVEACVEALRPYVVAGARDLLLGARPPIDWQSVESFVTQVAPRLRELIQ